MSNLVSHFNINGTVIDCKDAEARSGVVVNRTAIEGVQNKNNEQDTRMNQMVGTIAQVNGNVSTLASTVTGMGATVDNLSASNQVISGQLSNVQSELETLDARMDAFSNLPEGSTAGDAELIDIRVGADGITYDDAGDAVRGQYLRNRELAKAVPFSVINSMGAWNNSEYLGITFTWLDHNTCRVNGTANGTPFNNVITSPNSLGDFVAGKTYHVNVKSNTKIGNLYLAIYTFVGETMNNPVYIGLSHDFTIPSNATGIIIRVQCNTGISYSNDTIEFEILNELSPVLEPVNAVLSRTDEINTRLATFGYCQLEKGTYYIGDPVYMPNNTSIFGVGKSTRVMKTDGLTYGLFSCEEAVGNVTFRDMAFVGSLSARPTETPPAVGELAISVKDNAGYVTVDNCHFYGFARCGLYVSSGYSWLRSVDVTNCSFIFCGRGVEFDPYGEYGKVTNCHFNECYYGAEVIGGNNNFANCGFDACYIGMYLYDDGATPSNDGHASASNCCFNHCYNTAIACFNIDNGYSFVGCEVFFGGIVADNSKGIIFVGCLMRGDQTFYISRNNSVLFLDHCLFSTVPTLQEQTGGQIKKHFCYTFGGTSV